MISCELCKKTFTRMQSLDRHNASKMHETRSLLVKKHTCECGKYYIHQQSLRNHRMQHHHNKKEPILTIPTPLEKMQQDVNDMKHIIIEKYEAKTQLALPTPLEKMQKEFNEMKEELQMLKKEKMQQEINDMKKEIRVMKKEKEVVNIREPAAPKSRDIRRKISQAMRKEIVNDQENKCGECKEDLSLYFQIDHIVGIQFGGTNDKTNLMALCCECHTRKSIAENQCREQIQESIQTILREKNMKLILSLV